MDFVHARAAIALATGFIALQALATSPATTDDFSNTSMEAWTASSPLTVTNLHTCLSPSGESCLSIQSNTDAPLLVTNNSRWAGNWRLVGAKQVRLEIGVAMGSDFYLYLGIESDPDGSGPAVPSCYVSPQQYVPAGGVAYTKLVFDLDTFVQIIGHPACNSTPRTLLQDADETVSHLRLLSSTDLFVPPTWDGTNLPAPWTIHVDNVRMIARSQVAWLWRGFKATDGMDCPETDASQPMCDGWQAGFLFGDQTDPSRSNPINSSLPGSVRQWCTYQYIEQENAVEAAHCMEALIKDSNFVALEPDFLGATPAQSTGRTQNACVFDPQSNTPDLDFDGCADAVDNCLFVPNTDQRDTDGDGIGNLCDGDFNQDCTVNVLDLGYFRSQFFTSDADADLNGDGFVNFVDLGTLRSIFFVAPGPSGQLDRCDMLPQPTPGGEGPSYLADILIANFEGDAGRPLTPFVKKNPADLPTRLAIIDTQVHSLSQGDPRRSAHGLTMIQMAHQMACNGGDTNFDPDCVVDLRGYAALDVISAENIDTTRKDSQRDPDNGGYIGIIGEVGLGIRKETERWVDDNAAGMVGNLVINLSVGWRPDLAQDHLGNWRALPVAIQTVFAAIEDARCRGALVIAAIGNIDYGPLETRGPIYPGGWQAREGVNDRCEPGGSIDGEPLVFAAGGTREDDSVLFNVRPSLAGSMPPMLVESPFSVFSDHAGVPPWLESPNAEFPAGVTAHGALLTGSSVASLVTSLTAAVDWHYLPSLSDAQIMDEVYASGRPLLREATVYLAPTPPNVRDVDLCSAVQYACRDDRCCVGASCPTLPSCPLSTSLAPDSLDHLLANFVGPADTQDLSSYFGSPTTDPACAGLSVHFSDRTIPFENACPFRHKFGSAAKSGGDPQPDDDFCPSCLLNRATGSSTLYVEISDSVGGTISDPVLRCGVDLFVLPNTTSLTGGSRVRYDNVPSSCDTAKPVWLTFNVQLEAGSSPDGEELEHTFVSQILRVPP